MRDGVGRIQTAVVFGGTSEIGLAIVRRLARDGLRRVVLAVRDPAAAPALPGLDVTPVAFDADDVGAHPAAVDAAFAALGDVDVAVVAFGVLGDQARAERDPAAAVAVMRTNLLGAVSVLTLLGERLRAQGHGAIVVLSSVAGERVRRANYVYGASKAGLDGFAQGLGDALAPAGIPVLDVRPGFVRTKMTEGLDPAPFSTTPDVVAERVASGLRRGAHTAHAPPLLRWVFLVMRHLPRGVFRRLRG